MKFGGKTYIMGILNVTPDSFSDGGHFTSLEAITRQVEKMISAGADIIDIGGESTRPFAEPVSEKEEMNRVIPAIEAIRDFSDIPISIDTTKASVAEKALKSGATIVNDISALLHDEQMIEIVRNYDGPLIIMHMQGTPSDMQLDPYYDDVVQDISSFFLERTDWLIKRGISKDRIIIDPGIGFGKTIEHNLTILKNISAFKMLGFPVLIGHSRKSFLGKLFDLDVNKRDCATAVLSALCTLQHTDIVRVHDVEMTAQAIRLAQLIN